MQVVAKDTYNDETATAELQLEVKSGRPRGQVHVYGGDPDQPQRGRRCLQAESLPTEYLWSLCSDVSKKDDKNEIKLQTKILPFRAPEKV